jgi:hypothetical protein
MTTQAVVQRATDIAARDVDGELNYLAFTGERPWSYTYPRDNNEAQTNIQSEAHRVTIRDLRALTVEPDLDREGFALVQRATSVADLYNEEEVRARYYPEVEEIISRATGAARVFIFDHTIRRRIPGAADRGKGIPRQPVARVHVDHTERSGPQRVRDLLPHEADELLRGRVQIINLWRPIVGPLIDSPLAVADARSIEPSDLVPSDLIYPHRAGETYSVKFHPAHRWYYVSNMEADEALLLKCYDSVTDGRARFAPHTAFKDSTVDGDIRPRESIEVRTLVFHPA